jgi:hypothetical protein
MKTASQIVENLLNETTNVEQHGKSASDFESKRLKQLLAEKAKRIIGQMGGVSHQSSDKYAFMNEFLSAAKEAEDVLANNPILKTAVSPEGKPTRFFDKMAELRGRIVPAEKLEQMTKDTALDVAALKTHLGDKSVSDKLKLKDLADVSTLMDPASLMRKGVYSAATTAGKAVRYAKPVVDIAKSNVDQLRQYAQILSKTPGMAKFGESALASLNNPSAAARGAFINQIAQNPEMRKKLGITAGTKPKEQTEEEESEE